LSAPLGVFAGGCSVCGIGVRIDDVVVYAKVGHKVVLVPLVLVFLELIRSSSLSFAFNRVASGD